jgi:hypothetical protein
VFAFGHPEMASVLGNEKDFVVFAHTYVLREETNCYPI